MTSLLKLARGIRHAPALSSAEWLWRPLRRPFHRLLDPFGRGVRIELAHGHPIRVPADVTGRVDRWKDYEPESVDRMARWLATHPDAMVLDLGCAIGIFTALALHSSPSIEVIAVDADLASLRVAQRVGRVAQNPARLQLVHGLVSNRHRSGGVLATVAAETAGKLSTPGHSRDAEVTRFVCVEDPGRAQFPEYTLDGLLANAAKPERATLFKCDVEGAEALVLHGASQWIRAVRPTMLLSVHPPALEKLGHTVAEVAALLRSFGYEWIVIARDHEEHWWAEPSSA